ncbi:sensor histidine kinase [Tenacibaculum sp. nBUS_03]|uniref:sensor histidine kinase n=1 Tax=Tenacibaculum sp. nBUS_03 TaxID=3395320 RepID=UPI003EBD41C7
MIQFLKKYKAFFFGLIIIPVFYLLDTTKYLNIPRDQPFEVFTITLFWWLVISLPIHNYKYLKTKKSVLLKVLSIIVIFFIALIIDSYMNVPDNPITFTLLLVFWLGFVYILAPKFIIKYWKLITLIYAPLLLYFFYLRLLSGNLDAYLKIKENFPIYIFFLPIPLLFLVWIFEQWKWLQNLKTEKTKTELSLLRTQINPHFFFNTLNNLYALTIKNSKQAPDVILKLSDMMRYTIYEGEKERVKLFDEIEYLNNYIELHKIRHKKSVEISFNYKDVNPHLTIAPLLYIMLLENSFKHGIDTLSENAFINIHLYDTSEAIVFVIMNNFDPNEIQKTKGIGLENLKKRLSLLYKNKHELVIDVSNTIYKTTLKINKNA